MSEPRTPFYIGQPVDTVLYVLRRTHRTRLAIQFEGREGSFLIDPQRKSDARIKEELKGLKIDLTQNLTVYYYLPDCTLKFKRYRGLTGKEPDCYRIVHIDVPLTREEIYSRPLIQRNPLTKEDLQRIAESGPNTDPKS